MLNLGIIYKDGKIINHRSLLKVMFNPFLRLFGIQIVTFYDDDELSNGKLGKIGITRCPARWRNSWKYNAEGCVVVKERVWF